MALPAKGLIDQLLAQVRDPQGVATTRAQALALLSRSQQQVNAALDDVVISTSFNVPPFTLIFPISATFPDCVRILSVRDASNRDLDRMSDRADIESTWINAGWLTERGSTLRSWGTIGRDLFVLRPGLFAQQAVTMRYTQLTPTLATEADSTVVPNEDDPAVVDLAALLIRLKSRDFDGLDKDFERFKQNMTSLRDTRK